MIKKQENYVEDPPTSCASRLMKQTGVTATAPDHDDAGREYSKKSNIDKDLAAFYHGKIYKGCLCEQNYSPEDGTFEE